MPDIERRSSASMKPGPDLRYTSVIPGKSPPGIAPLVEYVIHPKNIDIHAMPNNPEPRQSQVRRIGRFVGSADVIFKSLRIRLCIQNP